MGESWAQQHSRPPDRKTFLPMIIRTSSLALSSPPPSASPPAVTATASRRTRPTSCRSSRQELQKKAQKTADDIKSGKVDAEKAAKDLQDDATKLTNDTLDAAKDSDIPDDVKKQLEDAQDQLDAAGGGS